MAATRQQKPAIKFYCSCIRNLSWAENLVSCHELLSLNQKPRSGDLVVVRVESDELGYRSVENSWGREVSIYKGDIFVALLGNRDSGTNVAGRVPDLAIDSGAPLDLLAQGGISGEALAAGHLQKGNQACPLTVIGFVSDGKGSVANIENSVSLPKIDSAEGLVDIPAIFVFGTSAETGKTTSVCQMIRWLREHRKDSVVACFKVCGTGRFRDLLSYRDAGAQLAYDFVDAGLSTTYQAAVSDYIQMIENFYLFGRAKADMMLFEVGGDILAGGAEEALKFALRIGATNVLVVNDAMGAKEGMRMLDYRDNSDRTFVATFRQNVFSLQSRLKIDKAYSLTDPEFLRTLFADKR